MYSIASFMYITNLSHVFWGKIQTSANRRGIYEHFLNHIRDYNIFFSNQKIDHTDSTDPKGDYKAFVSYNKVKVYQQSQRE